MAGWLRANDVSPATDFPCRGSATESRPMFRSWKTRNPPSSGAPKAKVISPWPGAYAAHP